MMKPEPYELELAKRARSGNQEALAELIEQPYTDSTILASYCTGFDLCLTSDADAASFQHYFFRLRTSLEPTETPQ